jgi:sec-independent protein translocase protein TatA
MDPIELIVIGVVVLVVVLWGPSKIPELARALGKAKGEYQKAAAETNFDADPNRNVAAPSNAAGSSDSKLFEVARSLGIATEGKTSDQIAKEIIEASKAK